MNMAANATYWIAEDETYFVAKLPLKRLWRMHNKVNV